MPPTEIDPFSNHLQLTTLQCIKIFLLSIILVPIRTVLVLLSYIIIFTLANLSILGINKDTNDDVAFPPWRQRIRECYNSAIYLSYWALGFRVTIKGVQAERDEAPILIVAPHSSFLDALLVPLCHASPLARIENKNSWQLAAMQVMAQTIHVDRRDHNSKEVAFTKIRQRASAKGDWPQLFICPEGTNTNRRALIQFKPGGFVHGRPIQPVAVSYPGHDDPDEVTWTWNQKHGGLLSIFLLMANPINHVQLNFLPVYTPSDEEQKDPLLYAKNVQLLMGQHLNIPATDITKHKFFSQKKDD